MASGGAVKMKPLHKNQGGGGASSSKTTIIKKKIETSFVDTKNKSLPLKSAKSEEKGKAAMPATPVKKREKKVFSLPGQRYDPPEEREPLRIFYESLSEQIPTSEMAEFWLMEHGILSPERAKKAYERKQRKQKQQKLGIPMKSPPPSSRPESSNRQKLASKNGQQTAVTPMKSPPPSSRQESTNRQKLASKNGDIKAKKRMVEDSDDEVIGSPKRRRA